MLFPLLLALASAVAQDAEPADAQDEPPATLPPLEPDTTFHIGGFGESVLTIPTSGAPAGFGTVGIAPILLVRMGDRFLQETELGFAWTADGSVVSVGYSLLDIDLGPAVLRVGKFLTPIGQFTTRLHPSWINKFTDFPLPYRLGVIPMDHVGVQGQAGFRIADGHKLTAVLAAMLLTSVAAADDNPLDGAAVYRDQCGRCHQPRSPNDLDAGQWSVVLFHMRTPALLTRAEVDALERFLAPTDPVADSPLLANPDVAAHCVRCHDADRLELAVASGRTEEQWHMTVARMRANGCPVDGPTAERIISWLVTQPAP